MNSCDLKAFRKGNDPEVYLKATFSSSCSHRILSERERKRDISGEKMGWKALVVFACMVWFVAARQRRVEAGGVYDVVKNGAKGDGKTDDAQAFLSAWNAACNDNSNPTMIVPSGKTFLITHVLFNGPCKSKIHVQIDGNIVAPEWRWQENDGADHWMDFSHLNGLTINGGGQIDGRGHVWWGCKEDSDGQGCNSVPDSLAIQSSDVVELSGLKFVDSPAKHVGINKCNGVVVKGLDIRAPGDSPNTDGVHIEKSSNVQVLDCNIGTGDDCISIGPSTSDLNITRINCGPGHGISVGSLGKGGSEAKVERVHVSSSQFYNTDNGLRIKTWQGASGYAKDITFKNVNFTQVKRPIIIDQFYCDPCPSQASDVQVSDVHFVGVSGSAIGDLAITLKCSQNKPCTNIIMDTVNIWPASPNEKAGSFCSNANGYKKGQVVPNVPCLNN